MTNSEPKHPPCDHRGEFLKTLTCDCSATKLWQSHACPQVEGNVCIPNAEKLNSSGVKKNGNLPHCIDCKLRTVNGSIVGLPTREELRKLRNLPQKEMTDARAKRLGLNPVDQAAADTFPRDRMVSDFELCRSVLHHDDAEFNPSIIEFQGQRVIAYRQNWTNSNILISPANAAWEPDRGPDGCKFLNIPIEPENLDGREDPRLFIFRGELWVSYTGSSRKSALKNTVCIGRIRNGSMDCHFPLSFIGRAPLEKNWVFFEYDNRLFCVYLSAPAHVILECDLFNCRLAHVSHWKPHYKPGVIRGGASPVLCNGEWYHFFHAVSSTFGPKVYTAGVMTFENKPPFRVTRCSKRPLIAPLAGDVEIGGPSAAVFPGGAVFDKAKGRWHVAYGYLDKHCRVACFTAADIEAELHPV